MTNKEIRWHAFDCPTCRSTIRLQLTYDGPSLNVILHLTDVRPTCPHLDYCWRAVMSGIRPRIGLAGWNRDMPMGAPPEEA